MSESSTQYSDLSLIKNPDTACCFALGVPSDFTSAIKKKNKLLLSAQTVQEKTNKN